MSPLEDRTLLATMLWSNASGGDWNVAANWVSAADPGDHHVPTSSDDAVIDMTGITVSHASSTSDSIKSLTSRASIHLSNGSLSLADASTISGNFTLSGGTLTGAGVLTIDGTTSWTKGTISGTGAIDANGGLILSISPGTSLRLSGRTLNNYGAATLGGAGALALAAGATLANRPGATFSIRSDADFINGGGDASSFLNEGIVSKEVGSALDPTHVSVAFNQSGVGTTRVQAGILRLQAGGTTSGTGTLAPDPGGRLEFGNGTFAIQSDSRIVGGGAVGIDGGTINVAGRYAVTGSTEISGGGVANLTGDVAGLGQTVAIRGGTLSLDGDRTIAVSTLNMSGGNLTGSAPLTIAGSLVWTGGTISGTGAIDASGGIALVTPPGNSILLNGRTLNNRGIATLAGNGNGLVLQAGATFANLPGASFTIESDADVLIAGGIASTFRNEGAFAKAAGTDLSRINAAFQNSSSSSISVGSGTINLLNPLNLDDLASLDIAGSATLALAGGVTGSTRNVDRFTPAGAVIVNGPGSSRSPQSFEVMGQDLGNVPAGFVRNFAYGSITLGNGAYVRLVDNARNSTGTIAEALYVKNLVVPKGTTLDLNGLHVYTLASQIDGTLLRGTVAELPSGGPISLGTAMPGRVVVAGAADDWSFFGRAGQAVTVVVNPGSGPPPGPLNPHLDRVLVTLQDADGNILGSVASPAPGATVTIPGVILPVAGDYHVRVQGDPAFPTLTGRYVITVGDATVSVAASSFGQQYTRTLASPYSVDRWTFSAGAGQQIRFNLIAAANPTIEFNLIGPDGSVIFSDLRTSSDLLTLPKSGGYILSADAIGGQAGAYAFRIDQTSLTDLTPGVPSQGTLWASGQPQLFRVEVATPGVLSVVLNDPSIADHNELYVKFGSPPARADYQYRSSNQASANQQILVPAAAAGTWYILLYGESVPTPSIYTIVAVTSQVTLTASTPDHSGNAAPITLTLSGAGFDATTTISVMGEDGTTYSAGAISIDLPTRITATFTAGSLPAGVYTVRAAKPGLPPAILPDALTVAAGGMSQLTTRVIVPSFVGRHAAATIYVEYANVGDVAMPAPLLSLKGTDHALLTLDPSRLIPGFYTSVPIPDRFGDTVQFLASGATPGILNPGESFRVPIYYAGLPQPWDFSDTSVDFDLFVTMADDTKPVDWGSLREGLRPPGIEPVAWAQIFANIVPEVGLTWGEFVSRMDADAAYLARLGERVTDLAELWQFEIRRAIGLAPIRRIASDIDVEVAAPGLALTLARSYSPSILDRSAVGPFGVGWSLDGGWQRSLTKLADGTIVVADAGGSIRRYQPDGRNRSYFNQPGDFATLVGSFDGSFSLREADGRVVHFLANGRLDYVEDTNGNRITADYTGGLFTGLTHSNGQSIRIAYNDAGRIARVTDPFGRAALYTYDTNNLFLLAVTRSDGATYSYAYDTGSDPATRNAMLAVTYPDGLRRSFEYDPQGRLSGIAQNDGHAPVTITYGPAGLVRVTDATNDTTQLYMDNRGLIARLVDPLGNTSYRTYDSAYQLTQYTDEAGRLYRFVYDARGNLVRTTDSLGATTSFTYTDTLARLASLTDANGNRTGYAYDGRGNLVAATYADGSVERAIYDARGNLTTAINRRGDSITYTYNDAGQVASKAYPDGSRYTYAYDAHGNLTATTDPGGTTLYEYDVNDRLTRVTNPDGHFLKFTYNTAGQRTSSTDQLGYTLNYHYDELGRLDRMTDGTGEMIITCRYDADGRLDRKDMGNGTYTTYEYDAAGQVLHLINHAPDGSINSRFDYTYDSRGRRTSMNTLQGTWSYIYDDLGQLIGWTAPDGSSATYRYDAVGNRIQVVQDGVTTDYTTNNLNQYTTVGGVTYTYDADGNLIRKASGEDVTTYSYDAENRLIAVVHGTESSTYTYDGSSNLTSSSSNGTTTRNMFDPIGPGNLVGQYDGTGGLIARYDYGLGLMSQADLLGNKLYFDFDGMASTTGLSGTTGNYLKEYQYAPFGRVSAIGGSIENPFTFGGQLGVQDLSSGLDLMRTRILDANLGRFSSIGTLSSRRGVANPYTYAGNQATSIIIATGDSIPSGLKGRIILGGSVAILGGIVAAAPGLGSKVVGSVLIIWGVSTVVQAGIAYADDGATPGDGNGGGENAGASGKKATSATAASQDPNTKTGPGGYGPGGYVSPGGVLPYRVEFENDPKATAPAQQVDVTDQLSTNLDWSTFRLTEVGFGDTIMTVPTGSRYFATTVAMTYNGRMFDVTIELGLDSGTGRVFAHFSSVDPTTQLPPDVLTGFLPPEDGTGRGMGYFSYTILPRAGLPTGTEIRNVARITFDLGETIDTNQVDEHDPSKGTNPAKEALVTIDAGSPTSGVSALAATQTSTDFTVSWSGQDDARGSGIDTYDVYVSDNGGPFILWLLHTTEAAAAFHGVNRHTYSFYSIATDHVGHIEAAKTMAESSTLLDVPAIGTSTTLQASSNPSNYGDSLTFTATVTPDSGGAAATGMVRFKIDGNPFGPAVALVNGSAVSDAISTLAAGNYQVTAEFTDASQTFGPSTGSLAGGQTVDKLATTTALLPSTSNPVYGQSWTFTAIVTPESGAAAPTGTVQFLVDGVNFGPSVILVNGEATSPDLAALGAGSHKITATYSGDENDLTSGAVASNPTVNPALLVVTAADSTRVYGQANPAFGVTYVGFVLGQDAGVLSGTLGFTTAATAPSHVGSYSVTPSGLTSDNYTVTFVAGNLGIRPAPLAVSADSTSKVAGQANPGFTVSYDGFVLGQGANVLDGTLVFATTATTASPAGTYPITPSGLTSTDYQIQYIPGALTITSPASLPAPTPTPTPTPTPPVTVVSISVETVKVGRGKKARKLTEIVVHYSGAVDPGSAANVASYILTQPGKDKKYGTKDDKMIKIASAQVVAPDTIALLPKGGKLMFKPSLQLRVVGSGLRDTSGRSIGEGRDTTALLGKADGSVTASAMATPSVLGSLSVDGLFSTGQAEDLLPPARPRRYRN